MMRFAGLLVFLTVVLMSHAVFALHPDEVLSDPVLEQRARSITREVRCLVCQGEAIDESQAPLAADLRRLVRVRLQAGDSDQDVRDYLTHRYGDYILMQPPMGPRTLVLWLGPFAMLGVGGLLLWRRARRQAAAIGGDV